MSISNDTVCIILAGGHGTRMASVDVHKVCFPIAGRIAIVRAIDTYKAAGVRRFLVVVGRMAEQVIAAVAQNHPDVTFVCQNQPRGTGHAAAVAVAALAAQHFSGTAIVAMGDKVTRPQVVRSLLERFAAARCDVLLTVLPKTHAAAGRVVTEADGTVLGIVEAADVSSARRRRVKLPLAGRMLTAARIEKLSPNENGSMYAFRFPALLEALESMKTDNIQGELYLTDTVEFLAARGKAAAMLLEDTNDLMGFNTPAELLAAEEVVRKREKPPRVSMAPKKRLSRRLLKPAAQWLDIIEDDSPKWSAKLRRIYGRDDSLLIERRKAMAKVVRAFIKRHGRRRPMVLVRAPGCVNLMGRHVDHRGGYVNVMAVSREVLLAAAPREDDVVTLRNLDARRFAPREFRIFDLLAEFSWAGWIDFLASSAVQRVMESARGDWSHYARAPLLRLQHECREGPLKGMDCVVAGNIPTGAGLSSSSALVVAFAEAAVAFNRLDVKMQDFIDLCGEGEWFVGSRAGSADHAAIRTGKVGYVSRIGFFPFRLAGQVRLPAGLRVVIADSGSQVAANSAPRETFDQRVACYDLAQMFLRRHWPAAAGIEHLSDVTPERLKVRPGEIYRALTRLPMPLTRRQLRRLTPAADRDRLEKIFSTHADVGPYDLRGVALFGIGESLRSEHFAEAVEKADLERIGRMMKTSHDGDRRVWFDERMRKHRHVVRCDDAMLNRLAADDADISAQCGSYRCSTEAIDRLVDVACGCDGVVGAQLAGAGLGGCTMILVRNDALNALIRRIRRDFYRPRKIPFNVHVCKPVAGAGLLSL